MFKRVVLKISGEGLAGNRPEHYDCETVDRLVSEVGQLVKKGVEVSIVVGGGNFWRGRDAKPEMNKARAHQIGMLATVMNGIYLMEAFTGKSLSAVVMTPFDVNNFTEKFSITAARKYLSAGTVVIFAGGTGLPFFSTDSIVAVRARELSADAVLYAKNVSSVYEADPKKDSNARRYKTIPYQKVIEKNLGVADLAAIALTYEGDIPSVVFGLDKPGGILAACENGEELFAFGGTYVATNIKEDFYE